MKNTLPWPSRVHSPLPTLERNPSPWNRLAREELFCPLGESTSEDSTSQQGTDGVVS